MDIDFFLDIDFLDIDRLFVQQLQIVLDAPLFDRYIANHMTGRRNGKSSFLNSTDGIESSVEIQRRKTMNRVRLLAVGTTLMFALTAVAQQTAAPSGAPAKGVSGDAHSDGVPTAQTQLKVLTGKLDLTGDQQAKITPILQKLHDATQKLVQDERMSRDERLDNVRACRYKADKEIREILNDDQKKKLDQLEQGPHPELHGNINGSTPQAP